MIKNYMEVLVDKCLHEFTETHPQYIDVLSNEKNLDDIRAKALNQLQPLYVTQLKGEVFGEYFPLQVQNKADIRKACIIALEMVANKPDSME